MSLVYFPFLEDWATRVIFCNLCAFYTFHTAGLDNIFVQIYMDALPGVPEVSYNQILFFKNESVEFLR